MNHLLKQFAKDVWIYEGETVSFHGMPYTTRMTVVRLPDSKLWIHSPSLITGELLLQVQSLGDVAYLVSPNKIHHLYLADWIAAFPSAKLCASPGLPAKRRDLPFDILLADQPDTNWAEHIDQMVFKGSFAMEEIVFFHKPSATLILTDLIENFPEHHFSGVRKLLARFAGILAPNGKTPIDWRFTFMFGGKAKARACLMRMLDWNPKKIIVAHGDCIEEHAITFLERSFRWLR